jgi:hypothetical protein
MKTTQYRPVSKSVVPAGLRWDVPQRNQGQIVEVAYAEPGSRAEAGNGDKWQRVTDRSDGSVQYFCRVEEG